MNLPLLITTMVTTTLPFITAIGSFLVHREVMNKPTKIAMVFSATFIVLLTLAGTSEETQESEAVINYFAGIVQMFVAVLSIAAVNLATRSLRNTPSAILQIPYAGFSLFCFTLAILYAYAVNGVVPFKAITS